MYDFCMDLFDRYPEFFTFFAVLAFLGALTVLFLIALMFYKIIVAVKGPARSPAQAQRDIDRRQDEAIAELSKEAKKALALEHELQSIKDRLGEPREEQ